MAGTFSGLPLAQQFDLSGYPLSGCLLYVYNGGTTTPSSVYQDLNLTVAAPWPLVADASGRLPPFFVADGNYHIRLTDANGVVQFDYPGMPSIGPSSTGSSGGAVDTASVFTTGDMKWRPTTEILTGWVRANGKTIGANSSGATEYTDSSGAPSCQSLYVWLWQNFSNSTCPVTGGRGSTALSDFNAKKPIGLLDMRAKGQFGLDDMGNSAASLLANVTFTSGNATTAASVGGEGAHTLVATEIPLHTHTATAHTHAVSITSGYESASHYHAITSHTHNYSENTRTASNGHTHTIPNHQHTGTTNGQSNSHTHDTIIKYYNANNFTLGGGGNSVLGANATNNYTYTSGNNSTDHTHTFTTDSSGGGGDTSDISANHTHSFSGTTDGGSGGSTGTESVVHTHLVSGNTGSGGGVATDGGTGGGQSHNNMPPFMLGTWYLKL